MACESGGAARAGGDALISADEVIEWGISQVEASTAAVRRSLDYGGSGGISDEQDEPQWLIDAAAALTATAVPSEDSLAQPQKPRTQGQERRRAKDLARLAKRGTG